MQDQFVCEIGGQYSIENDVTMIVASLMIGQREQWRFWRDIA
jgi:hypothetical protein